MSLVERLMHWGKFAETGLDTEPPAFEPADRWIATHEWYAANLELLQGNLTAAQIKSYLGMTPEEEAEYDLMIASVTGEPTSPNTDAVLRRIDQYHSIGLLSIQRITGYQTPALVRAKMGI